VLPVVSAIAHSANVVDCLIWSAIALVGPDRGLFYRQDPGAEPVGADCGRRTLQPRSGSGLHRSPPARSRRLEIY